MYTYWLFYAVQVVLYISMHNYIIISSTFYFLTGQFQDLLRAVLVPRGMSLKFPMATRDPQKSGTCFVLEHEKALKNRWIDWLIYFLKDIIVNEFA